MEVVPLAKLTAPGVGGGFNLWLSSYLKGKTQTVVINDQYKSINKNVTSGVLQSRHSPLFLTVLWMIYVTQFADDLKLFSVVSTWQDCLDNQADLGVQSAQVNSENKRFLIM